MRLDRVDVERIQRADLVLLGPILGDPEGTKRAAVEMSIGDEFTSALTDACLLLLGVVAHLQQWPTDDPAEIVRLAALQLASAGAPDLERSALTYLAPDAEAVFDLDHRELAVGLLALARDLVQGIAADMDVDTQTACWRIHFSWLQMRGPTADEVARMRRLLEAARVRADADADAAGDGDDHRAENVRFSGPRDGRA